VERKRESKNKEDKRAWKEQRKRWDNGGVERAELEGMQNPGDGKKEGIAKKCKMCRRGRLRVRWKVRKRWRVRGIERKKDERKKERKKEKSSLKSLSGWREVQGRERGGTLAIVLSV
jgi:hypothetical protein